MFQNNFKNTLRVHSIANRNKEKRAREKLEEAQKQVVNAHRHILVKQVNDITPSFFASVALTLYKDYGFRTKRINKMMALIQENWNEIVNNEEHMLDKVEELTGMTFKLTEETALKEGDLFEK